MLLGEPWYYTAVITTEFPECDIPSQQYRHESVGCYRNNNIYKQKQKRCFKLLREIRVYFRVLGINVVDIWNWDFSRLH